MPRHTTTPSEQADIQTELDTAVRESLRPTATGLAVLYVVFAVSHAWFLPPLTALPMAAIATASAGAFLLLRAVLGHHQPRLALAHPLAAGVSAVVLINSFAHLLLTADIKHTTNVALTLIGVGGLVLHRRWFAGIIALGLGLWVALVVGLRMQQDVVHFAFMLFGATLLSLLIFIARMQTFTRLAQLHSRDQQRTAELEAAMATLRHNELVLSQARDAAEAASHAKNAFLAIMSHELRSPLGIMLGYTQLLTTAARANDHQEYIADLVRIQQVGGHLQSLIDDALDLARIEAGKLAVSFGPIDVALFAQEVAGSVQPIVAENHNQLRLHCEDVGQITSDELRLRQVLINLLANAAKFTEHGTITLAVERLVHATSDVVLFRVSDTGIGMTSEQLAQLFNEYTQLETVTRRKYGGAGLGLAFCRRLCHLLHGDIFVTSAVGVGTTVTVRLPATPPDPRRSLEAGPDGPSNHVVAL
jgi:signal transduction histidine kinase